MIQIGTRRLGSGGRTYVGGGSVGGGGAAPPAWATGAAAAAAGAGGAPRPAGGAGGGGGGRGGRGRGRGRSLGGGRGGSGGLAPTQAERGPALLGPSEQVLGYFRHARDCTRRAAVCPNSLDVPSRKRGGRTPRVARPRGAG